MQDARTRGALIVLALLIGGSSGAALWATRRPAPPPVVITPAPDQDRPLAPTPIEPNSGGTGEEGAGAVPTPPELGAGGRVAVHPAATFIYVHVAGAVKKPSLYALPPGSRVMQAVRAAGGPAPAADLDAVNLAERVQDGEKVYIPRRQPQDVAPSAMPSPPGNALGHVSVLPPPGPTPPLGAVAPQLKAGGPSSGRSSGGGRGDKLRSPSEGHVALNTASADELQRLPGVGPAMAARILAYRQQAHGFRAIDDLQNVTGIGPKKFAKIAPLVTLD